MKKVTTFGNMACYSLHANKVILEVAEELTVQWAFQSAEIETIIADKLKRIDNVAFGQMWTKDFALDSLMYVGSNCLRAVTNPAWNYQHKIYFKDPENAKNWYQCIYEFKLNEAEEEKASVDEISLLLYNGHWEYIESHPDCFQLLDPDEVINNFKNSSGIFVRKPQ